MSAELLSHQQSAMVTFLMVGVFWDIEDNIRPHIPCVLEREPLMREMRWPHYIFHKQFQVEYSLQKSEIV